METHVDEESIRQLAKKLAKDIKTESDLGDCANKSRTRIDSVPFM